MLLVVRLHITPDVRLQIPEILVSHAHLSLYAGLSAPCLGLGIGS